MDADSGSLVLCLTISDMLMQAAGRVEQSRVRQCIFFKMLTEFTLKYGNCIGVLLKADTSASSSRDTAKTPVKAERSAGGTVFR